MSHHHHLAINWIHCQHKVIIHISREEEYRHLSFSLKLNEEQLNCLCYYITSCIFGRSGIQLGV